MAALFSFGSDDVFASSTEVSALSAFRSLVTLPLLCGARVARPSAQGLSQPVALAEDCVRLGVTQLTAVPQVLRLMAQGSDRISAMTRLRTAFSGSGALDQGTRDLFVDRFGVPAIGYYGAREFATAAYASPESVRTVSSGGGIVTNCLVGAVHEAGALVAPGEAGEVMVHSDCLTLSPLVGEHPDWLDGTEQVTLEACTRTGGCRSSDAGATSSRTPTAP